MTTPDVSTLKFTQGDANWRKLRKRAITDLYWFCDVVLGYGNLFPFLPETHAIPCRFMERRTGIPEIDLAPRQMILIPRECGKSAIKTIGSSIQLGCANPNIAILIAGVKGGLAEDFLKTIKHHFETNELLRSLFPEVIPPDFRKTEWSKSRATLNRESGRPEPTYDTIGVGGSIVGKHYDKIIADDLIDKDVADSIRVGTGSVLQDVNFWIDTLNPQLSQYKPFPTIDVVATRWWVGDSYDHVETSWSYGERPKRFLFKVKTPRGKIVSEEVYRAGDIAVLRLSGVKNGKPSFPEIWSQDRMNKMREDNPELFACFVMNDPSDAAVRTFNDEWISFYDYLDKRLLSYRQDDGTLRRVFLDNLAKVMCVDPAFSTSGSGSRAAIVLTGTDRETNKHLVLEAIAQKVDPRDLVADILNVADRYQCSQIFIEAAGQQMGFIQFVQSEALKLRRPVSIDVVRPGGRAKDLRIEGLAAYFKNGQIVLGRGQNDFLEEYRQFKPGAVYKDLLDALAYCSEKWVVAAPRQGWTNKLSPQAQRQQYLAARGLT